MAGILPGADSTESDCFFAVAEKLRGAYVEFGHDGTVWLMPNDGTDITAVCWKSIGEFLLGNEDRTSLSVFRHIEVMAHIEEVFCGYQKLLSLNEWVKPLAGCSSLDELRLILACIG